MNQRTNLTGIVGSSTDRLVAAQAPLGRRELFRAANFSRGLMEDPLHSRTLASLMEGIKP